MAAPANNKYIISGGAEGKKRLHVLSDVLRASTRALIESTGPVFGKQILDLGCGGGNVSIMMAQMTGITGHVTGVDFDDRIIALAEEDALAEGVSNIDFMTASAYDITFKEEFDLVYSRFLLSHLTRPGVALQNMLRSVKPGGRVIVEDVQFSGHFCYPPNDAFSAYISYYTKAAENNGQHPEIGPTLVSLFYHAGLTQVGFDVIQPCFNSGPGKQMGYLTLEKISPVLISQGLANEQTINNLLDELIQFTSDETTIISLPRIFRVWGVKADS